MLVAKGTLATRPTTLLPFAQSAAKSPVSTQYGHCRHVAASVFCAGRLEQIENSLHKGHFRPDDFAEPTTTTAG
jgi:hypothetical protein